MTIGPDPINKILWMSVRRGISCAKTIRTAPTSRRSLLRPLDLSVVVEPRAGQHVVEHLLDGAGEALHVPSEIGEAVQDALLDPPRVLFFVDEQLQQRLAAGGELVAQKPLYSGESDTLVHVLQVRQQRLAAARVVLLAEVREE